MGSADEIASLVADLESSAFAHGVDQGFWTSPDREGPIIFIRMAAADGRVYTLRLRCDGYGSEPISGEFVTGVARLVRSDAWPRGNGFFQQWVKFGGANEADLFICWDQDRKGISHHAADWAPRKAWLRNDNQLVAYLTFVAQLLNNPYYGYECQPRPA